jgi:hypothetical protein
MTMSTTPPGVAALNRHGHDTLMSHPGIEITGNSEDKPVCALRPALAVVANSRAQAGSGT